MKSFQSIYGFFLSGQNIVIRFIHFTITTIRDSLPIKLQLNRAPHVATQSLRTNHVRATILRDNRLNKLLVASDLQSSHLRCY